MPRLGVNIDHVATLRQARRALEPDPVAAAVIVELAGADGIVVHLREDRRHILDRDVEILRATIRTRLNLEMAATPYMVALASRLLPDQVTLVPERREEITTEGGLDVAGDIGRLGAIITNLKDRGIVVSVFVDPDPWQVDAAKTAGADQVELHTGPYAQATFRPGWNLSEKEQSDRGEFGTGNRQSASELARLEDAAAQAKANGLVLAAGHGLTYWNVRPVAQIAGMAELNIGHTIVSRAVMVGLARAVRDMKLAIAI